MNDSMVKDVSQASERMLDRFAASREAVSEALEEGKAAAKHLAKRTRRAVTDFVGDAEHRIKRFPIRSVAVAFGAGAVLGMLVMRNGRR